MLLATYPGQLRFTSFGINSIRRVESQADQKSMVGACKKNSKPCSI
jgi:hypothetical protein